MDDPEPLNQFKQFIEARTQFIRHFVSWKAEDGRRLSATVLNSYAELLAIHHAHPEHAEQAAAQMKQLRTQLHQLIGEEQTRVLIEQLQEAQEQQATSSQAQEQNDMTPRGQKTASQGPSSFMKKGFLQPTSKQNTKKRSPPSSPPTSPDPTDKYRNWALAHRLLAGDTATPFALPPPNSTQAQDAAQVRVAVLKVMDERLSSEIKSGIHTMLKANLLELRGMLVQLVPNRSDMIRDIEEGMPVVSALNTPH